MKVKDEGMAEPDDEINERGPVIGGKRIGHSPGKINIEIRPEDANMNAEEAKEFVDQWYRKHLNS